MQVSRDRTERPRVHFDEQVETGENALCRSVKIHMMPNRGNISMKNEKALRDDRLSTALNKSLEHFDEKMKRSNQTYATYF